MAVPTSVDELISTYPADRQVVVLKLRQVLRKHLPPGFEETVQYGMLSYVVPHAIYPKGYHCKPQEPLPFIAVASQKAGVHLYHMGIYADAELLKWFQEEYAARVAGKLDMGKSCIRFKKPELIPYDLVGELAKKMTPAAWINLYEQSLRK